MFGFQLGREYKLSIAEIFAVFPKGKTIYFNNEILILDNLNKDNILNNINNLGGTIKVFEISDSFPPLLQDKGLGSEVSEFILEQNIDKEGKLKYGINIFGEKSNLKKILNNTKILLKKNSISSRFVNKDFNNLNSSQIIGEKLIKKGTDYNLINSKQQTYIGRSIWVQNISSYSKRDWQKDRDMQVGMLPPKLSQMMINLSREQSDNTTSKDDLIIYDPFVGLGTVLIESILMGNQEIYGSDLSEKMVEISLNNILDLKKELKVNKIFKHNSKYIGELDFLSKSNIDSIVTEGYLGEIMTRKNINLERINKQKEKLQDLYEGFFSGLKQLGFKGNIVISFPFWEMDSKYIYFNEIYDVLSKYCDIQKMFPKDFIIEETKAGSLLYKRDNQLVGREIFKLKIK